MVHGSIASTDADEPPFTFEVRGTAFSTTADSNSDGLSDWAEFNWSSLGYDWEVSQSELVSTLFSKLVFLHRASPGAECRRALLQRDPMTGTFTLTIGVKKITTLLPGSFDPFPMTAPQTLIDGAGELEFQFTVPDDAAFFQLRAE